MATFWKVIAAERTGIGALWAPQFSLDLMRRDYSVLSNNFHMRLLSDTVPSATTPSWVALQDFWIEWPDFSDDDTLTAMATGVRIVVTADDAGGGDGNIRLSQISPTVAGTGVPVDSATPARFAISVETSGANIASGRQQYRVEGMFDSDTGGTLTVVQSLTEPDCEYYMVDL